MLSETRLNRRECAEFRRRSAKRLFFPATMTIKSKSSLLRAPLLCLLLLVTSVLSLGQDQPLRIKYWLAMSRPNSHLFEVNIEIDVPADAKLESLDFQMPKWSPGRYAVFEFAKNVQEVRAESRCPPNFACEQI